MTARTAILVSSLLLAGPSLAETYVVDQVNKTFIMNGAPISTLEVKKGDSISFKNGDKFFHNIFSLSDIQIFDLGSYPFGEARSVQFDEVGTVEVECAIHPDMHMTVEVK